MTLGTTLGGEAGTVGTALTVRVITAGIWVCIPLGATTLGITTAGIIQGGSAPGTTILGSTQAGMIRFSTDLT